MLVCNLRLNDRIFCLNVGIFLVTICVKPCKCLQALLVSVMVNKPSWGLREEEDACSEPNCGDQLQRETVKF